MMESAPESPPNRDYGAMNAQICDLKEQIKRCDESITLAMKVADRSAFDYWKSLKASLEEQLKNIGG